MKVSQILKKWTQTSLVLRILCGLVIGAVLGLLVPGWTGIGILGTVFVSALKAIAPVLVGVLVAASIARAKGGLGPRFRTVITLYLSTTLLAAFLAVVGSFLFPVTLKLTGVEAGAASSGPTSLADVFTKLLTDMVMNPVAALANANYIGILFWAIILGVALRLVAGEGTIGRSTTWLALSPGSWSGSSSSRPSASWAWYSLPCPATAWRSLWITAGCWPCWLAACSSRRW